LNNYKLVIQYDGTNYSGWQIQLNSPTIQQKITEVIKIITREKVNLIGSGRTDSGVHALGQVANFRTELDLDLYKFKFSLNSILPEDISVIHIEKVLENFHSRFDAKKRSYIYLISHIKSPFFEKYSYRYKAINFDGLSMLNMLSKTFLGEHDFSSFTKKSNELENKLCNLYDIHWRRVKDKTIFYIEGNRFLRGMVRAIVGTLLYAYEKNLGEFYLKEIIERKNRCEAEESVPAKGLFLFKVKYEDGL
jgi:tRNA pseudouridine38-40 synthase